MIMKLVPDGQKLVYYCMGVSQSYL